MAEGISLGRFRRSHSWKNDGTGRFAKDRFPCPLAFPSDFPPRKTDRPAARSPCSRFRSVRLAPGKRAGSGRLPFDRSPVPVRFPPTDAPTFRVAVPESCRRRLRSRTVYVGMLLCPSLREHKIPSGKRDDTASRYFGICIRAPVVRFSRLGNRRPENGFGRPTTVREKVASESSAGRSAFPEENYPQGETGGTFSGPESPDYFFRFINSAIFLGRSVLSITPLIPSAPVPYR